MSTTQRPTRSASYYRKMIQAAYEQHAEVCKMRDAIAALDLDSSMAADELDRYRRMADEYEGEIDMWIDRAASAGFGPDDIEAA